MAGMEAGTLETFHGSRMQSHTRASTIAVMDSVAGLLDGPRARDAFLLRVIMDPPWSIRIRDEAPLTLVAIVRGDAYAIPDRGDMVRLRPGAVAIMRGPDHYTLADDPATEPQVVVHPEQRCETPD